MIHDKRYFRGISYFQSKEIEEVKEEFKPPLIGNKIRECARLKK